jgi:hypothetical protein
MSNQNRMDTLCNNSARVSAHRHPSYWTLKRFKKNDKGEVWLETETNAFKPIKDKSFDIGETIKPIIKKM